MSSKIHVGNLAWSTTDYSLRDAFMYYGAILSCTVMIDRETGRSKGFGFVTYGSSDEAETAISSMNEQELDGRRIKLTLVNARGGGRDGRGSDRVVTNETSVGY